MLSDRFRSLWTFYQFLSGVYKHTGHGPIPFRYDFQAVHRRLQDLLPQLGLADGQEAHPELDRLDRDLVRIHAELAKIDSEFSPSALRRFFDHLKRQDEKVLFALVKFYLMAPEPDLDTMDKLDILLTRLAEAPLEDGRSLPRDPAELLMSFERLATFAGIEAASEADARRAVLSARGIRAELQEVKDFEALLASNVYDRFRQIKRDLGPAALTPSILVELVAVNIEAKNRFRQLYAAEEVRILEDTNRIFEIERYIERNPDIAHDELQRQIDTFRTFRIRYDSGRKEDNLKREHILELRQAMHAVLEEFDPIRGTVRVGGPERRAPARPVTHAEVAQPPAAPTVTPPEPEPPVATEEVRPEPHPELLVDEVESSSAPSVAELLPPDPMLNEVIHKIVFALELAVWDHSPEQAVRGKELHHLRLEPWEAEAYRVLASEETARGSHRWELQAFLLTAAALRVRMEEEIEEIARLSRTDRAERLFETLEQSAQSLERARELDRRFQWFIDDMLYRGDTDRLEQIYRSHFRFLNAFSRLWLDHQSSGGVTPL
jgi:hypothetical protein